MQDFEIKLDVEPKDKYEKAKKDLYQSMKSYSELTQQQKQCLLQEAFGVANVAAIDDMLKRHFGKR